MKLEVRRSEIVIIPETALDTAYIEDTLGLKREGDAVRLVRVAPLGLSMALAYLKAAPAKL